MGHAAVAATPGGAGVRDNRTGLAGVATSVSGVLAGRGADITVIDDPLKPEEVLRGLDRVISDPA
jgi:hypothetical protein